MRWIYILNTMILCIKTDSPDTELYLYNNDRQLIVENVWHAHRELSVTLLKAVEKLLCDNELSLSNLQGVVVYSGPGSFTGLRIGISFANTLAYSLGIPAVGAGGAEWIMDGLDQLDTFDDSNRLVVPNYGSDVHITAPRK
jgi:tRNA threonylcarbamoyladenosine biosynthesis protein TsaB